MIKPEKDPKYQKIRSHLSVIMEHWRQRRENTPTFDNIFQALETDTLEGYVDLVDKMYEDRNFAEAERLQAYIDEIEETSSKKSVKKKKK